MSKIELYHGTSYDNYNEIVKTGQLIGPVYFTPVKNMAHEYGDVVITLCVNTEQIKIDWESTDYDPYMSVEEAIAEGISLYIEDNVEVSL